MDMKTVFSHVDHTLLKPTATWEQIRVICEEGLRFGMASVCIPPCFVKRAKEAYPALNVCTVIGFPLGYNPSDVKAAEARQAIAEGAGEIDMVVNLGDVKAGEFERVTDEIRLLKKEAGDKVLKVIIETCYLTDEEKTALCRIASEVGPDFIKTSTGLHPAGGATVEDVRLIKETAPRCRIKASGGIRTAEQALAMLAAGADRLGASAGVQIIHEFKARQ